MTKTPFKIMQFNDEDSDFSESFEVKECFFNGYSIGQRIIEDLPIRIYSKDDGTLGIDAKWPEHINGEFYEKKALEFIMENDLYSSTIEQTDDDCWIDHPDTYPRNCGRYS